MSFAFRKWILSAGVAAALFSVTGGVTSVAHAQEENKEQGKEQQQLKPKVVKALIPAQEAMKKEDWETADKHISEAKAVSERGPYDDFMIAELDANVQLKRSKYAESLAAFEKSFNSGFLPADQTKDRLKIITQLQMQLKSYPQVIENAKKLLSMDSEPQLPVRQLLAQSYYVTEQYQPAADTLKQMIPLAEASKQPVEENWLQMLLGSQVRLQDAPGVLDTLKRLAVTYPQDQYLKDLYNQWKRVEQEDRVKLNLYRLMFELNRLEFSEDYMAMAQLASSAGFPGEAITILERGNTDKKFVDEVEQVQYRKQLASAKTSAQTDRKAVAATEATIGSKGGEEQVQLGLALASYGEFGKAAQWLQSGITKGGVKRLDQAQIMLGYALHKANRTADAQTAFSSIDPASQLGVIAQLWRAYVAK
jgi:hypothetical protein